MKRDNSRMVRDCEYYGNFVAHLEEINAIDPPRPRDYPNWHQSEARLLLKADITAGLHKTTSPKDLYMTRPEYQLFPLEVFRKHIYEDIDERSSRAIRFAKKGTRATFRESWHTVEYLKSLEGKKGNNDEGACSSLVDSSNKCATSKKKAATVASKVATTSKKSPPPVPTTRASKQATVTVTKKTATTSRKVAPNKSAASLRKPVSTNDYSAQYHAALKASKKNKSARK